MKSTIQDVLRELRKNKNITQTQLANELHISQRAYSHYENGTREPNIELLIDIANYYQISIDYLVGRYK
ncbi:MAG: helix-turn-helix domain-containing protein [Ruminococcus sp.]|nr:helix-turn-helix domain-containing protein [Ruminococcus sp.]MDE5763533.1 helix-turn-helix domain-containing protein [Ruminococcus sp.]MDE7225268.1 helix-turn-helix domain-containing protein [Ruminococcus sp.]